MPETSKTTDDNSNGNATSSWDEANFISKYFLYYIWPLLWRGEKSIGLNDQQIPPNNARADKLTRRLEDNYLQEVRSGKKSCFLRAILKTFGPELIKTGLADIIARCLWQILVIVAMGWLIRDSSRMYDMMNSIRTKTAPLSPSNGLGIMAMKMIMALLSGKDETLNDIMDKVVEPIKAIFIDIIIDTVIIIVSLWLINACRHPYLVKSSYVGLKCRVAATNLVYKKVLRLNQESLKLASTGRLTNMLSNDVNRFEIAATNAINLLTAPLQVIVVIVLMDVLYIGLIPTMTCLASIVLLTIIQSAMGGGFANIRLLNAIRSDERIRIINELIVGIRIIKMYAWEEPLKKLVQVARRREINMVALTTMLNAFSITIFLVSYIITCFGSLVTYILLGMPLYAEVVFVTMAFCRTIRFPVMFYFPNAVANVAETIVSCARIDEFLRLAEHEGSCKGYKLKIAGQPQNSNSSHMLSFDKVNASWDYQPSNYISGSGTLIIKDLSLKVRSKELMFVIGRVGAGKSSVLMSILGELPIISGSIEVNGKLSYCPQEAWVYPGSVRDNILFGSHYDHERYQEVLKACSLIRDVQILPYGDETLVGERGISLSGGQKARVNLARSLYHEADIYLLDDPLSAVDPPVAREIFRNAIQGFLKDRCVILATHQLQFVPNATSLLVVDPDQPANFGTVDEVYNSDSFKRLHFASNTFYDANNDESHDTNHDITTPSHKSGFFSKNLGSLRKRVKTFTNKSYEQPIISKSDPVDLKEIDHQRHTGTEKLTDLSDNAISYRYYISAGTNPFGLIWFVIITIISQFLIQYTDIFLGFWADSNERRATQGKAFKPIQYTDLMSKNQLIIFFSGILILTAITSFMRSVTFYSCTLRASIIIHNRFFASIIRAPIRFFDFNPIGILLNRLGRDIGIIDGVLPQTYSDVFVTIINVISPMILAIYVNPWNAIVSVLLIVFSLIIRSKLSSTIIKLKSLEGVRGAPIFTHLSVTLNGLTTIRAFKTSQDFELKCDKLLDSYSAIAFLYIGAAQLMSFMIANLSVLYSTIVILTTIFLSKFSLSPSTIGLIVSQVICIPFPLQWAIRLLVEAESQMSSVARVRDYSDIEPEETQLIYHNVSSIDSPTGGHIKFINVSLRYFADEPYVLHNLNLSIEQGEKIGVVGRTGAGKSSIISTLFRLYPFEGRIEIDGQDTKLMSLRQLRSSISIIPQDPILFAGSIRKNLDPFSNHTDEEIWNALEAVRLKTYFMANQMLEHQLHESGSNMSVGQRQLICLARAIIRQNNILVLDEATANVDPETDEFIQQTIQNQFRDCSVITIAHRLITIAGSDRVLVLDQGEVKEFDEPYKLLHNKSSIFRQMVEGGKKHQTIRLRQAITDAHDTRKSLKDARSTP